MAFYCAMANPAHTNTQIIEKTKQTKKTHLWPLVYDVTGNDTTLGM